MMFAVGWAVVRSSREPYREAVKQYGRGTADLLRVLDGIDQALDRSDEELFGRLEEQLRATGLDWRLHRTLNNMSGVLTFASSSNHRGVTPWAVDVLHWLATNGPGSYALVYLHDDEDVGEAGRSRGRDGTDRSNEFRVWRLLGGRVEELDDPFLSPIVPRIDPNEYA